MSNTATRLIILIMLLRRRSNQKVAGLRGEVILPRTTHGPAFKAYFTDPGGNLFGL